MSATALVLRLLGARRAGDRASALTQVILFTVGAALASCWNVPLAGPNLFIDSPDLVVQSLVIAAALGVVGALCIVPHRFPVLRAAALVLLVVLYLFWLSAAVAFGVLLAWSVPVGAWIVAGALAAVAVVGAVAPRARVRVPVVLPLGIVISALLVGWGREDGRVRCDDYLRVRSSSAAVLVPSTPELERCSPGDSLFLQRYPRRFWEYPDGHSFLVTTQRGLLNYAYAWKGDRIVEWFNGAICQAVVGSGEIPPCFFDGKAQAIAESPLYDRLYVAGHDRQQGMVFALPRFGPFRPLAETNMRGKVGGAMYVDEAANVIGLFEDYGWELYKLRASDLASLGSVPAPFLPDEAHYDPGSNQGIACAAYGPMRRIDGQAYAAVAFKGDPFEFRPLAPSSEYPSSWLAMTWGCDWDPATRRAYVAIASLGLLEEIDYDTGRIMRRFFIGLGVRAVVFDAARRRIYANFFLSGDVIAIDVDSGVIVDRWFVGRFARFITLSRDRSALLATSTLGIVRIALAAPVSQP